MKLHRSVSALALLLAATLACTSVGPDYEAPARELAPAWQTAPEGPLAPGAAELEGWWRHFSDPVLDALVARAVAQNLDLAEALARLDEARALRAAAAGERWPTVEASAGWRRSGESENTPLGAFVPDTAITSGGFDARWELDLWGRVRRSLEADDAALEARLEDARAVLVTITAEVAQSYVELRAAERRLALARTNVALQEETLALVRGRQEAGLVGEIDVAQARTNVESTRSRVPSLEAERSAAANRLTLLLGLTPGELAAELASTAPIPVPPARVAVGVPADLLRRRADVRRAERELAAETARIGLTEAELYPVLTLSGNLGLAAEDAGDLFEDASGVFGVGPSLRWNLFDGGRVRARVRAQEARTEQALVRWEKSVLAALEESENAMTRFLREGTRRAALRTAAAEARVAVELARTQYTEGLSDFQAVLVSERALAELEDALAISDAALATGLVTLYKALGGGWEDHPAPVAQARDGSTGTR